MRKLYAIATEIERHRRDRVAKGNPPGWTAYAEPYIRAMRCMQDANESYGADTGLSVVLYGLSNLDGWRGPDAKRLKAELKEHADAVLR